MTSPAASLCGNCPDHKRHCRWNAASAKPFVLPFLSPRIHSHLAPSDRALFRLTGEKITRLPDFLFIHTGSIKIAASQSPSISHFYSGSSPAVPPAPLRSVCGWPADQAVVSHRHRPENPAGRCSPCKAPQTAAWPSGPPASEM